ncbi:NADPH-dependent FMN reductase [Paenibacillus hexagrammi]|uniref:NAD(P)H-dependent oxidoreductase n=1 Tax=Paenibacillus hexagrammi TaxID=2908839 RepID=A0ABY3SJ30_9BACL|nr:NADPH-dependent FMN reductase [Paenibacillus sp. YPD9-1]UJF33530.1 NAD(P)H-dependent oxidoreductase [Paenibacillus sp. YPD9-1]
MSERLVTIMAISGSLRQASANTRLLRAAAEESPAFMHVVVFDGLGELPHFNPDLDGELSPQTVKQFRSELQAADGLLVCTPEYAGGVPGVLKNALDWLVSSGELMNKPTAVISASPLATAGKQAHESLMVTLRMMSASLGDGCTLMIPHINKKLGDDGSVIDPGVKRKWLSC